MAKWIRVHTSYKGEAIWLNSDLIWRILPFKDIGRPGYELCRAMILRSDIQDDYFTVTETPEQIMELIDAATALADALKGN